MKRILTLAVLLAALAATGITACVHKPQLTVAAADGNYPDAVGKIILNKCTYSGCHNTASHSLAGDLLLDSWEHMLEGCNFGAVTVAYSTKYSPILLYCDPASNFDTGHFGAHPRPTAAEYTTVSNWIAQGAPDKNGNIPFAKDADTRQKIYVSQSGCNLVAVIDGKSKMVMRYIPVGGYPANQSIHDIKAGADGKYAYVTFLDGGLLQKIDTRTDTVTASADLSGRVPGGNGQWSVLYISPADTAVMVTGYKADGYLVTVNTATMLVNPKLSADIFSTGSGLLTWPHGIAANAGFDTFFTAMQYGNVIRKLCCNATGGFCPQDVSIDHNAPSAAPTATSPDPHQVLMSPDHSKYFVTCQKSNEVRVMDAYKDTLIAVIPVGALPQEGAICAAKNYLFISCSIDEANRPQPYSATGNIGTVYVIDYNTYAVVKILTGDFNVPHGLTVDNKDGLLYVASRNNYQGGIPPHHSYGCSGNPGWYTVYDINTLLPADKRRYEIGTDPYTIGSRY